MDLSSSRESEALNEKCLIRPKLELELEIWMEGEVRFTGGGGGGADVDGLMKRAVEEVEKAKKCRCWIGVLRGEAGDG